MEIEVGKRIIDYVIDQAERYDLRNLEIEQEVIDDILHLYDRMADAILRTVEIHGTIDTTLKYQNLVNRIQMIIEIFYSDAYKVIQKSIPNYVERGYDIFDDLINVGMEMENKLLSEKVSEIRKTPDPNAIEFMRKHAFEQVTGLSDNLLSTMKSKLGELLVKGVYDKQSIKNELQHILGINRSRAEMIAQTEMSMAYNKGALMRMEEFNRVSTDKVMMKYWHGFKYSVKTCTYCRPRIGNVYAVNDNSETLPAHPRCRCIWLPFIEGWDSPIPSEITRKANMLKRVYSPEEIYARINKRLGIKYADLMDIDDAIRWINGDRSDDMLDKIDKARDLAIKQIIDSFDIATAEAIQKMGGEYNAQMRFWKKYVAEAIVDNNKEALRKAKKAIQGVMVLPWSGQQLKEWDKLIDIIDDNL